MSLPEKLIINGITYVPEVKVEESKKPREFWILPTQHNNFPDRISDKRPTKEYGSKEYIHVCEFLPGSVTITKEQLAAAWDKYIAYRRGDLFKATSSAVFDHFSQALGLEDA